MALIHQVASSFLPEKLARRAALSSEGCKDMGGAVGAKGVGKGETRRDALCSMQVCGSACLSTMVRVTDYLW